MDCPICGNDLRDSGRRDRGDKLQADCPRCGKYEISRTALAMLNSHTRATPTSKARLSHALRISTSKEDIWASVSSANLDDLLSSPLPDIHHQTRLFLSWFAEVIGDDVFGTICLPPLEHLAAVVGAVDASRVKKLIQHVVDSGYLNSEDNQLNMTQKGWDFVECQSESTVQDRQQEEDQGESIETIKSHCSDCDGETNSDIKGSFKTSGSDDHVSWSDTYYIVQCRGCESVSFRHESWFSEHDEYDYDEDGDTIVIPGIAINTWPKPCSRQMPDWVDYLKDDVLRALFAEIYSSLDNDNLALALMGTRTLLDRSMFLVVGDVKGGFVGKIEEMIKDGHLGAGERDTVLALTDIGSAAAHRGYIPNRDTLDKVLSSAEAMIHRVFILPADAAAVKKETPPKAQS